MTTATDTIDIRLTGRIRVVDADGSTARVTGRQTQILLAMLVLEGGSVSAERVAEVLWGDDLSDHWRGALRGLISKLRNALTPLTAVTQPLSSSDGTIRLDLLVTSNVSRVETLIATGEKHRLENAEIDELRELTADLHHPFLIHNDSSWVDNQRRRIEALTAHAEQVVLEELKRNARTLEAVAWAEHVIARDPVNIRAREILTRLHLETEDLRAGRRTFQDLERVLATEFGQPADPELSKLVHTRTRHRLNLIGLPATQHHPDAAEPFIGREGAIEAIAAAWTRVQQQRLPELVVIRGPGGIGKTRLADWALANIAPPQQLWGRARPAGGHTWGPFVDALASTFSENASLAHTATVEFPSIGRLLPDLDPEPWSRSTGDDAPRDTALGVARQIAQDIAAEPVVLVMDDLHWTGADGLTLIESVLTDTTGPLLVIATCREVPEPVAAVLATVARHITVTDITLEAFDLDELGELVRNQVPSQASTVEDVARLHHRTGGLPYFACALMRDTGLNGADSHDGSIPESVSVWLDNFLRTLTPEKRRMLEVISVFGTDADLQALEAVIGGGAIEIADTIDALASSGLATIDRRANVRIPHDLTTRAVWTSIGAARKAVLHRLAGDHLATRNAAAATVAAHWSIAGPSRQEQALQAHLRAGSGSLDQGAWRAALGHFSKVQEEAAEPETHLAAMIGSGRALIHLRDHDQARRILEQAIDLAAHHGNDHAMAEATLLLVGRAGRGAIIDDESAQLARLRAARDRLLIREGTDDDPLTQILLANIERELAISLLFVESLPERQRLLNSALERIRATPEASTNDLALAILGLRMGLIDAANLDARAIELEEVLALPHAHLEADTLIAAHLYRHESRLQAGLRTDAAEDLVVARGIADAAHHAYWQWAAATWEALGLLLDGSLDAAEVAFGLAAATRPTVGEAIACHQVNLATLRLMQGRSSEMIGPLQAAVEAYPGIPTWRAALALLASESGDATLAAAMLESFVRADFEDLPRDTNRFFALGILGHVAATLGSVRAAQLLWDLLVPYRGRDLLLNVYGGGGAYWGPVEWALARLGKLVGHPADEVMELWDEAVERALATPVLLERISREAKNAEVAPNRPDEDRTGRSASTS